MPADGLFPVVLPYQSGCKSRLGLGEIPFEGRSETVLGYGKVIYFYGNHHFLTTEGVFCGILSLNGKFFSNLILQVLRIVRKSARSGVYYISPGWSRKPSGVVWRSRLERTRLAESNPVDRSSVDFYE